MVYHVKVVAVSFSALLALGAAGCGAATNEDADSQGGLALTEQAATSASPGWSPYQGGPDGVTYTSQGGLITGVRLHSGWYVDHLQIHNWSKNINEEWGGSGGDDYGWQYCPTMWGTQTFLVGIFGHSGSHIDQLGFICSTPDGKYKPIIPAQGGNGGDSFSWQCATGYSVRQLEVHADSLIEGIRINCQYN